MTDDDALQTCVDEVLAGRKTPAECAASNPQYAELEADLRMALSLRSMQSLALSEAAYQRIEARLSQRASALKAAAPVAAPLARPAWRPGAALRWLAGPALAASLLLAGFGTTAAAASSNPGDLLYGVKRADESAQAFLSPPAGRALVYTTLARHRLGELSAVLQRDRPDAATVTQLSADLTSQTGQALAAVGAAPVGQQADILSTLAAMTDEQQTILAAAEDTAPSAAQPGLQQAQLASAAEHARALEMLAQATSSSKPHSSPTASPTATATLQPLATATATPTATDTLEPSPLATATEAASATPHGPPGQTDVPPGQTKVPPGQTKVPPGLTHRPPDETHMPPGQTLVPPGQTQVPPGMTKAPPGLGQTPRATDSGGADAGEPARD